MKYKEWLCEWLEHYIRPSSKARTYTRYVEIVNQHINEELGEYEIDGITPIIIQRFVTQLSRSGNLKTGKGLSPNSVNSIINVVQGSLETANRMGVCNQNAADKIKRPKISEKQVTCFIPAEQKKIEQAVLKHRKAKMFGIFLCLYTGLRIGELLALEWTDIDFSKGELLTIICTFEN